MVDMHGGGVFVRAGVMGDLQACGTGESGAEAAALQTLREVRGARDGIAMNGLMRARFPENRRNPFKSCFSLDFMA